MFTTVGLFAGRYIILKLLKQVQDWYFYKAAKLLSPFCNLFIAKQASIILNCSPTGYLRLRFFYSSFGVREEKYARLKLSLYTFG